MTSKAFAWAPCDDSDWLRGCEAIGLTPIYEDRIEVAGRSMLTCAIAELAESERPVTIVTPDGSLRHPYFGKIDTSETVSVISWRAYQRRKKKSTSRYSAERLEAARKERRAAVAEGRRAGRSPFGYYSDSHGQLRVDPRCSSAARGIFEDYAAGVPVPAMLDLLRKNFPKRRWSRQVLHHILRNPIYRGGLRNVGTEVQIEALRLVSDDLFNRVRVLATSRSMRLELSRAAAREPEPRSHAG